MPKAKPKKKPKKKSTDCKCADCKKVKIPNKVERAIASLHFENPMPWHDSATLQRLVTVNYSRFKDQADESGLDAVSASEALHRAIRGACWYPGPDDDESFTAFVAQLLAIEIDRNALMVRFMEHRLVMLRAISEIVTANKDLGADLGNPFAKGAPIWSPTVDEIYADVAILLLANPWWVLSPATSKVNGDAAAALSTRLAGFAKWQARAWKTRQLRAKKALRSASFEKFYEVVEAAEDALADMFGLGGRLDDDHVDVNAAFDESLVEEEDEVAELDEESEDFFAEVA